MQNTRKQNENKSPIKEPINVENNKLVTNKYSDINRNGCQSTSTESSIDQQKVTKKPSQIIDLEVVEQKSNQTKLEIEQLKADLEELINSNIKLKNLNRDSNPKVDNPIIQLDLNDTNTKLKDPTDLNTNRDFKFSDTNSLQTKRSDQEKTDSLKENVQNNVKKTQISFSKPYTSRPSLVAKKRSPVIMETPKTERVKHYDPKSAREYMKKQKLQRQNKLQEEIKSKLALKEDKRRKLKELQDKTLKIIYNKQKTPKKKIQSKIVTRIDLIKNQFKKTVSSETFDSQSMGSSAIKSSSSQTSHQSKKLSQLIVPSCHLIVEPSLEQRTKAATLIQCMYRGYKQRLQFKRLKTQLKDFSQQYNGFEPVEKKPLTKSMEKIVEETKPVEKNFNQTKPVDSAPSWLQPATVLPYPYNFITAVKQKLTLALYNQRNVEKIDNISTNSHFNSTSNSRYTSFHTIEQDTNSTRSRSTALNSIQNSTHSQSIKKNAIPSKTIIQNSVRSHSSSQNSISHVQSDPALSGQNSEFGRKCLNSTEIQSSSLKSELRLNLDNVNTVSTSKSSENIPEEYFSKEIIEILSPKLAATTNQNSPISSSPNSSTNSTGRDIESAILSASEFFTSSNNDVKEAQILLSSSKTNLESNKLCDKKKIPSESSVKTSYENTFTSHSKPFINNPDPDEVSTGSRSSPHLTAAQQLIRPTSKLRVSDSLCQNLITQNTKTSIQNKPTEINLKFQAEIKLLETFKESLKQIAADNAVSTTIRKLKKNPAY